MSEGVDERQQGRRRHRRRSRTFDANDVVHGVPTAGVLGCILVKRSISEQEPRLIIEARR